MGEKAVIPQVFKYKTDEGISMSYDILPLLPLLCLLFVNWEYTIKTLELPPFIPNEYLFETHKDKGKERWEIYAWAVRDAMSKYGDLPKCD